MASLHSSGSRRGRLSLVFLALLSIFSASATGEPVQYCKFSDPARPNEAVDFCLGLTTMRNASTNAHNVWLTLTHTRRQSSAKGWTAVGTGDAMAGSLMFIVYGDPASGSRPIVKIARAGGHSQPELLSQADMGGGDMRVLRADWLPGGPHGADPETATATAVISAVCYSCTLWPGGQPLSGTTRSQPWIWAWNAAQEFEVFTYDAHLLMHAHHAGNGGWGRFYVDMARAESAPAPGGGTLPSLPVIRPGVAMHGASETPDLLFAPGRAVAGWYRRNPAARVHGALMVLAFLVLFPAGVVAMRSGAARAFTHHWVVQAVAMLATAGGVACGLATQRRLDTAHQVLGLVVAGALVAQACLGWKHHVDFVRIRRRTWISHSHLWLGRGVMAGGYVNLILGLLLQGYSRAYIGVFTALVLLQATGLVFWVWRQGRRNALRARTARYKALEEEDMEAPDFTLASPEESGDESEDEKNEAAHAAHGHRKSMHLQTTLGRE
ncbi:hypothetical protein F4780DRAFT_797051 [Xylariomycetidae sp. FL0641]|nr:hypothetical protein F4780DRAFT_797051 [Xylariomycetidae sp. FL0641]